KAFTSTALGQTISGEAFDPLRAELLKLHRATPLQLRPAVGLGWSDVAGAAMPVAIVALPMADHSLGWVILFARPQKDGLLTALTAAEHSLVGQGFQKRSTPPDSSIWWTFSPPAPQRAERDRAIFVSAGVCGVASDAAAAEPVVAITVKD